MTRWLPLVPFPPLSWWRLAWQDGDLKVDWAEGYRKQTLRNRLLLTDAKGQMDISLPIDHAHRRRHEDLSMSDMRFSSHIPIRQIMRAIQTAYGRAPYFEHVMPELEAIMAEHGPGAEGATLGQFSRATLVMLLDWSNRTPPKTLAALLETQSPAEDTSSKHESGALSPDLWDWPRYGQPFEDRNGFLAGRSSLDTLFCVGPSWAEFLPEQRQA